MGGFSTGANQRSVGTVEPGQDPLGKQAWRRSQDRSLGVWSKPLYDGSLAVGLFNRGVTAAKVTARWADLGITGSQPVRDLWQRRDLGPVTDSFSAEVPSQGAVFVRIGR